MCEPCHNHATLACAVVSTDDVAWHHSFFGWADLLATGVLEPARRGEVVAYRPSAWQERGRAGAIEVPAGRQLLLVEGVGAGRRELTDLLDAVVWVQSDFEVAERRGVARDVAQGVNGNAEAAVQFWHEWMAEELTFLAEQRPWERACAIVAGTPPPGLEPPSSPACTSANTPPVAVGDRSWDVGVACRSVTIR